MAKQSLQLTLALIKPDATKIPYIVQDIRRFILSEGFYIVRRTEVELTQKQVERFYEEHRERFFYNRLTTFMRSGPTEALILLGENAIPKWRSMMGATKVYKTWHSDPHSIRGTHGLTDTRNTTHGSDSTENAIKEMGIFFPDFDVHLWSETDYQKFRHGLCKFDEEKQIHEVL